MSPEKKENYSPKELGIYHLADDIDFKSAKEVIEFILSHDTRDRDKLDFLTLIITSYGGLVDGAFAITDIIAGSSIPVHTVGLGVIASAGLMIFMAGAKGHRTLTPNTAILSHQYSGWAVGKEHELIASRKQQDLVSERIVNHYRRHTGMREEQIKKLLLPEKDVWLSAKEALNYKLCDKVSTI